MTIQARFKDELFEKDTSTSPAAITAINTKNKQAQPEKPDARGSLTSLINELLIPFEGYGLNDLNNANLMNRVDSKFMLPLSFLPELLTHIQGQYRVLDIQGKRLFSYYNQYFDTPELDLYKAHHNGKLNRYKVRQRRYVDTATEYLEVKLKNNQSRTVKTRIKLAQTNNQQANSTAFIKEQMKNSFAHLNVTQQSGYNRIALANEEKAERLTLDFNLWYNTPKGDNKITLPGFFIAELKQSKKTKRSPFYKLMSKHHIFPASFSKYCIGCALLYPERLKVNRFKPVLARLKHLNRTNPLLPLENN
ncbi:polyphosphate polymerase domain-containing protein [Pseudoalteromonas sp. 1CM17D]|uniref:polyphosphate polymerase domain-containing protein n=1 Tax=Pseudoalteromonas sp. 1CM17D TaxID=2929162 RepID=UPI0020C038E2|nr:polyphosphate polymerase domain-containing protein [Pseudoalteromonas sp. 1CM17D]MCK8095922.1 polyphosphate polymerase domain-containing protein [Pseudoalteromonas sp. 1CM17D]